MRRVLFLFLLLAGTIAQAQTYFIYENSCTEPGQPVITQGLSSVTPAQINHIPCQVNVFLHGTSTRATLFSDDLGTPLGNPFNSQANGYYHFEVNVAGEYDVTLQNTVTGNPTLPPWNSPFSISGIQLGASGGGGGGSPGGSPNDVQINAAGIFGGTGGLFQFNNSTHILTLSGLGQFVSTGAGIDFSGSGYTKPFLTATQAVISGLSCTAGSVALATDTIPVPTLWPCLGGLYVAPTLPAAPGTPNQFLLNVGGVIGGYTGLFHDPIASVTHFPGGASFDSTKPFSISGICPSSAALGVSSVGQALIGWDVGCIAKISFNATGPFTIALQGFIDYTYLKEDANGCLALTSATGDVGIFRVGGGVLGVMNCATTSSPSKLNIYNTFSGSTNSEFISVGYSPLNGAYYIGPDHGSISGNYHPLQFGAAGITNPFWQITTVGPLTCLPTNPSCDFGSITASQQIRNMWQAGFLAENIIGPTYPVNSGGVQIGLVASPTANNPVQALTSTTAQLTGTLGIVAFLSNGNITGATIVNGGAAYTAPTCQVSNPPLNSGVVALCTAHQTAGVIDVVTITNPLLNNGYQSIQSTVITINDNAGSGAQVIPIITATGGFAGIAQNGSTFNPIFDGSIAIRNQIVGSGTVAGELHDSGLSCTAPRISTMKVYGCGIASSAGGAGTSVPMQVSMTEATDYIVQAITPSATTCPTAAAAGSACKDTITLPTAFGDANYASLCYPTAVATGVPSILAILPADKGAGSFKIQVTNITGVAAQVTSYDCDLRHK